MFAGGITQRWVSMWMLVFLSVSALAHGGAVTYSDGRVAANAVVTIQDDQGNGASDGANGAGLYVGPPAPSRVRTVSIKVGDATYGPARLSPELLNAANTAFVLQSVPTILAASAANAKAGAKGGPYTLGGTIYGGSNPLPGATVTLFEQASQTQLDSTVTDSNGVYSFSVSDGTYSLLVSPPSGSGLTDSVVNDITVNGGNVTQNVVLLRQACLLSGTVYSSDGVTPVSGLSVQWYDVNNVNPYGNATSDANGHYEMSLAAGTYYVRIEGGSYNLNVPAPNYFCQYGVVPDVTITGNTQQDIILPAFATLSGQTLGNSSAVPNTSISANGGGSGYSQSYATSDENGNYSLILLTGTYSITASPPNGSGFVQTGFSNISVSGNTTYDISLSAAWLLSGTVFASDGVTPVSGLSVQWYDVNNVNPYGNATSDANGHYEMSLAAGTYYVRIEGGSYNLNVPAPNYFCQYGVVPDVTITGNTQQDITLPAFVSVSGKTTDSNAVPVPQVSLSANGGGSGYSQSYATSDENGNYSLILLPGTYSETITPPSGSGFVQTGLSNLNVSTSILQNVILNIVDTHAPLIIAGPFVSSITDTAAVVEWQTNEMATSEVQYGVGTPSGSSATVPGMATSHAVPLTGLTPNTTYSVQAFSSDQAGNGPTESGVVTFTTLAEPDTTPPSITEGPIVTSITHNAAHVTWVTDEPADGVASYGPSTSFGQTASNAAQTMTHDLLLTGLTPATQYFVQVASTDAAGNGPTTSRVISFFTLAAPDTTPPVIVSGPMAIGVTDTEATIIWTTNEPATSGVSYNDGTAYGVAQDEVLVTEHSVRLAGLTPSTTYNYTVSSRDAAGNGPTLSATFTFTTLAGPDIDPPVVLEGPMVVNVTHHSAVIRWRTDEPATGIVGYGLTTDLGSREVHAALTRPHNMVLLNLEPSTLYYFRVVSVDSAGNTSASAIYSFTTEHVSGQKLPVITEGPTIIGKTDTTVTIYWETNVPADSVVDYGPGLALNLRASESGQVQRHQITLASLSPGTDYSFMVSSTDRDGNTVSSAGTAGGAKVGGGFTTNSDPDLTAPAILSGPEVVSVSASMVTIRWTTDEIADSRVEYGLQGQPLGLFDGDLTMTTQHVATLTNLATATGYSFRVGSRDVAGNGPAWSGVVDFTTGSTADTEPPVVSPAPSVTNVTSSRASVTWGTNEYATSQVFFGTTPTDLGAMESSEGLEASHSVVLTNLTARTTYYYVVVSMDQAGNQATSSPAQFRTGASFADTDADGLPDVYEQQIIDAAQNDSDPSNDWIVSFSDVRPGDDFDGDGVNNGQEYIWGTDPTNPLDAPQLPATSWIACAVLFALLAAIGALRSRAHAG